MLNADHQQEHMEMEGMKKQGMQGLIIHREADATGGEAAVLLSHLDPGMDSISLS